MFSKLYGPRLAPILQSSNAECGLACAAMILNFFGISTALSDVRRRYPVSQRGTSLRFLISLFDDYRLVTRPLRLELNDLRNVAIPSILHWDFDHFVVLESCDGQFATIIDPSVGRRHLPLAHVSDHFTGVALEVSATVRPLRSASAAKISIVSLLSGSLARLRPLLTSLAFLTLAINLLALALPMLLKVTFDRVVPRNDFTLMQAAVGGFVAVALVQFMMQMLRARALANFRRALCEHLTDLTFTSLIWGRLSFFEARSPEMLATQYRSVNTITNTISEVLIAKVIDGLAIVIGVIVSFTLAWTVGVALLVTILSYFVVVSLMQRELRSRLGEYIQADSRAGAFLLETISAMQTIKLYSLELLKLATWKNLRDTAEYALSRFGVYRSNMGSALELVASLGWILVIYLLVIDLHAGSITVGVFTAVMSWTTFVIQRTREISQAVSEVNSLEEHVARIEDILSCDKEPVPTLSAGDSSPAHDLRTGTLRLEQIGVRYDSAGPWILQGCDIALAPGKMTVICGQSGIGKTTVLKVVLGLIAPVQGDLSVDGKLIQENERLALRRHCAAVLQNDSIFMGSIRDNIAFFDVAPDDDWIRECARVACIDEVVQSLPMKYGSLIGKDGAGFSAGQLQRFMLARALYRRPQLLVLDEFSSHLDEATEKAIIQRLKATGVTILTAAHRVNVIDAADVVFEITSGRAKRVR